jgi:hypothetical protein
VKTPITKQVFSSKIMALNFSHIDDAEVDGDFLSAFENGEDSNKFWVCSFGALFIGFLGAIKFSFGMRIGYFNLIYKNNKNECMDYIFNEYFCRDK